MNIAGFARRTSRSARGLMALVALSAAGSAGLAGGPRPGWHVPLPLSVPGWPCRAGVCRDDAREMRWYDREWKTASTYQAGIWDARSGELCIGLQLQRGRVSWLGSYRGNWVLF